MRDTWKKDQSIKNNLDRGRGENPGGRCHDRAHCSPTQQVKTSPTGPNADRFKHFNLILFEQYEVANPSWYHGTLSAQQSPNERHIDKGTLPKKQIRCSRPALNLPAPHLNPEGLHLRRRIPIPVRPRILETHTVQRCLVWQLPCRAPLTVKLLSQRLRLASCEKGFV